MYRSRSPLRASTKSSLNRPAYCFSGSGGSAIPGNNRVNAVCRATKCENRLWTVIRMGSGGSASGSSPDSVSDASDEDRECESAPKTEVTAYIVYAPDSVDVRLFGECTRTRNGGTFARHEGPASTKCRSASARCPSTLSRLTSSSSWVGSRGGWVPDESTEPPWRTNSSAPVVTKLENLFRLLPRSRLRRKLGNHSPVVCGMSGFASGLGEPPRRVIEPVDASRRLRWRV